MPLVNKLVKSIQMIDQQTVELVLNDKILIDLNGIKAVVDYFEKYTKGEPFKRLIVTAPATSITKEARFFWHKVSTENKNVVISEAILVHNLPQKMIANFYFNCIKDRYPTKFFTNLEKAKDWLKEQ